MRVRYWVMLEITRGNLAENYPANPYTLFNTFKQLVTGLQLLFVSPSVLSSYHKKEREL